MGIYETTPAVGHEFENLVFQDYWVEKLFTYADMQAGAFAVSFPVEAGTMILSVALRIDTLFEGTSPVLQVGDGSTADGYLATTDVDAESAGAFGNSAGVANAYQLGVYYSSSGLIIVDCNVAPTAGAGRIFMQTLKVDRNWRLPAAS